MELQYVFTSNLTLQKISKKFAHHASKKIEMDFENFMLNKETWMLLKNADYFDIIWIVKDDMKFNGKISKHTKMQ